MNRISEELKMDVAYNALLNNTTGTGEYFSMKGVHRALFHYTVDFLTAAKTGKLEVLEATDEAGSGAAAITGADCTITANTNVYMANVALASTSTGDTITINGVVFTQGADSPAAKTFDAAASLKTGIELPANGLSDIVAADVSSTNVILRALDGKGTLTVVGANVGGTVVVSTLKGQGYVEIERQSLTAGFSHVAAKCTTTDAIGTSRHCVVLLRQMSQTVAQAVGDYGVV